MGGLSRARRGLPWILLIVGLLLVGKGGYMSVKAALAQTLIASSWHLRDSGNPARNPWPWADTRPVARLTVPRLGISQFVMQDASGESLAFGPGLLRTDAEIAGRNTVIAGHRDTHFSFLGDLRPGDKLILDDEKGETTTWRVHGGEVFDARDGLALSTDQSTLRLVTCWPLDAVVPGGTARYQVFATPLAVAENAS